MVPERPSWPSRGGDARLSVALAARRDLAQCRTMLRGGSRTFYAASFLLPRSVRQPASALYAFCRLADDAVDLGSGAPDVLAGLRERLTRVYQQRPIDSACDRAMARVVHAYAIPIEVPLALLEGLQWDAEGRRYRDLSALRDYAVRVAGSVGVMMALLMGVRQASALRSACQLGVAMQFSNIARDVGEDAHEGRVYLPLEWLEREAVAVDALVRAPRFSPGLARVVKRLLVSAEHHYTGSGAGVVELPPACRPGINAARTLYREIGREVQRRHYDSVSARAVVSARRKARVLSAAVAEVARPGQLRRAAGAHDPEAVSEGDFLVDAVIAASAARRPSAALEPRDVTWLPGLDARIAWLMDLFERLERRDRSARRAHAARVLQREAS